MIAATIPRIAAAGAPTAEWAYAPVRKATNADVRIMPSIPMLVTPDRSHITPHNAPKAIGTAYWTIRYESGGTRLISQSTKLPR